jgi:RimJ/RimL family protein N-acetyltransferase
MQRRHGPSSITMAICPPTRIPWRDAIGVCLPGGRQSGVTSEIETPRLLLRPLTEGDEGHFVKLFADPRVTRYITLTEEPMPRQWAVEALQRNLDAWHKYGYGPWSAIHKETGIWIGKIDLIIHEDWPGDDKTEVGWELDPAFWGQGLATEGGSAAIRYGFTELELPRIISVTTPKNVASLASDGKVRTQVSGSDPLARCRMRLVCGR